MSEKLKPCPFCGCENITLKPSFSLGRKLWIAKCDTCDAVLCGDSETGAKKLWNRRPDRSKAFKMLMDGIMDINPKEIKAHDTEDRMEQWIKSWKAYMQKWLRVLDQELKDWEGEQR